MNEASVPSDTVSDNDPSRADTPSDATASAPKRPKANRSAIAWLQLARAAAVFTTFADIGAGFLLVRGAWTPPELFATLCLSSGCLYAAGMILNDYFDRHVDAVERPKRPIPSGRITAGAAAGSGFALLGAGVFAAAWVGPMSCAVASVLALCIVAYDALLKRTSLFGPLSMGACRALNLLLGASVAALPLDGPLSASDRIAPLAVIDSRAFPFALGTGLYIAGVTWFARHEAGTSPRWQLGGALMVVNAGLGWLAWRVLETPVSVVPQMNVALILGLVGVTINRRALGAIFDPRPAVVQGTIRLMLTSLVVIDATLALTASDPWPWPVLILSLLIPVTLLGKRLAIT